MKKCTICDIARANKNVGRYYFSPDTLAHWGQTLRSFKVRHAGERVFVYAKGKTDELLRENWSFAEFDRDTCFMRPISAKNEGEILEYLDRLKS